jgi:hypothetical protein
MVARAEDLFKERPDHSLKNSTFAAVTAVLANGVVRRILRLPTALADMARPRNLKPSDFYPDACASIVAILRTMGEPKTSFKK